MWQKVNEYLFNEEVYVKIGISIIICIIAVLFIKFLNIILNRWQRRYFERLKQRNIALAPVETKVDIVRRMLKIGVLFMALVFVLLQFETVRSLGAGLLASAGVAGIIIGMAAQNSFSNVIAGLYISFVQPIRLQDSVIFEGDYGVIEEISLMNTIIRTWDNRRIIVPNDVLANRVIQNWTMKDPSLLGIVVLYVDYYCDVDKVRAWVREIVNASEYWTRQGEPVVQVIDATEKSMLIRVLAQGADAARTWSLRCEIREKLIKKFKEENIPMPRIRLDGEVQIPQVAKAENNQKSE